VAFLIVLPIKTSIIRAQRSLSLLQILFLKCMADFIKYDNFSANIKKEEMHSIFPF
jgi:hypothetical protein